MSGNKSRKKKKILGKAILQNRRMPIFVIAKTSRRLMRNPLQRNWRRKGLKLKQRMKE